MPFDDPYLLPDRVTLRNKLGITDRDEFAAAEADASIERSVELYDDGPDAHGIPITFDGAHIRAIHRHLFSDVYDWAGEYRVQGIQKGEDQYFASPDIIAAGVNDLAARIAAEASDRMSGDRAEAVEFLTDVLLRLNWLHPFREGNGRTQRMFSEHLAGAYGYDLTWQDVEKADSDHAFAQSMRGYRRELRELIDRILTTTP